MSKRLIAGLCMVVVTTGVVGLKVLRASPEAQTRPLCTLPDTSSYSPGAVARHGTTLYQCVYVYGEQLAPAGVAWVKVATGGTLAVPMQP
jgi:hypothetical protein